MMIARIPSRLRIAPLLLIICTIANAQSEEEAEPTSIEPGAGLGLNYSFAEPNAISFELNVVTRSGIIGGLELGGFFNSDDKPTFVDYAAPDSNVTAIGWRNDPELFLLLGGGLGTMAVGNGVYTMYSFGISQQPSVFLVQGNGGDRRVYKNESDVSYRFIHGIDLNVLIGGALKVSLGYYTRRKWTAGLGVKF